MTHGNHSSAVFNVFHDIKKYLINSSCFILNSIYNSTVITLYNSSLAMSHIQRPFSAHNDMRRQLNLHSHLYLYMNVRTREDTTQINYELSKQKYAQMHSNHKQKNNRSPELHTKKNFNE